MNADLVTIVVPAYNAEQFLCENIEAIINQSYRHLEIIYVCDGCTDRTVEILQEYAKKDSRIIVQIEAENNGAAVSRNIGMNKAKGNWIIFLDADDWIDTGMIEEMLDAAVKERADLICCYWGYFDDGINEVAYIDNAMKKGYCSTYPSIDTREKRYSILQLVENSPVTKLVHRSIYIKKEIFFQDIPNANDVYYSMSVGINSQKIVYIDKAFYHYRGNKNRHTLSTDRDLKKNYIFHALDKIYDYMNCKEDKLLLLRSFYNKVFDDLRVYLDCPVYGTLFDSLKNVYFSKWGMYKYGIIEELSYVNRILYRNILDNKKNIDKQAWHTQAKIEFIRDLSKQGCSIWGAGLMGSNLLREISNTDIKIQHVFDSAPDKWGKIVQGYIVENFDEVHADNIIITVPKFYNEIVALIGKRARNIYNLEKQIWLIPDKD